VKLKVFRNDPEPSIEQFNTTEEGMMTAMGEEVWTKIRLSCEDVCQAAGSGSEGDDDAANDDDDDKDEEGGVAPPGSDKCTEDAFCDLV